MGIISFLGLWIIIFILLIVLILPSALWFFSFIVNIFRKDKKTDNKSSDFKLSDLKEIKGEIK